MSIFTSAVQFVSSCLEWSLLSGRPSEEKQFTEKLQIHKRDSGGGTSASAFNINKYIFQLKFKESFCNPENWNFTRVNDNGCPKTQNTWLKPASN